MTFSREWKALATAIEENRPSFWAVRGAVDDDWNGLFFNLFWSDLLYQYQRLKFQDVIFELNPTIFNQIYSYQQWEFFRSKSFYNSADTCYLLEMVI